MDLTRIGLLLSTAVSVGLLLYVARLLRLKRESERQRRDRASDDLADRSRELAALSSRLQTSTEREKAELARNLHDELGGLLTAARMDLSTLQRAAAGTDPVMCEKLRQLSDALALAMNVKRRVVESLRPALLDHFGLATALQNHFEETCANAGLHCRTVAPDSLVELHDDLAIALFRVGQESLANIVRHARATNVTLDIGTDGGMVLLSIADDGVGMDPGLGHQRATLGICGMRHRVESLGGVFLLDSAPGTGTHIRIRMPHMPRPPRVVEAEGAPPS